MPKGYYQCKCGQRFSTKYKMGDKPQVTCDCGNQMKFVGNGWDGRDRGREKSTEERNRNMDANKLIEGQ